MRQVYEEKVFATFGIPAGPVYPTSMVVACPSGGVRSEMTTGWTVTGNEYARAYNLDLTASQSGDVFLQMAALTTCNGPAVTSVGSPVLGQIVLPDAAVGNYIGTATDQHGRFYGALLQGNALSVVSYDLSSHARTTWSQVPVEPSVEFTGVIDMAALDGVAYLVVTTDGDNDASFVRVTWNGTVLEATYSTNVAYNKDNTNFFATGGCVSQDKFLFNNIERQGVTTAPLGCGGVDPQHPKVSVSVMVPNSTSLSIVRVLSDTETDSAVLTITNDPGECKAIYLLDGTIYFCTSSTVYTTPLTFEAGNVTLKEYASVTRTSVVPHTFPVTPLIVYEATDTTYQLREGSEVRGIYNETLDTVPTHQMKYYGGYGSALFTGGRLAGVLTPYLSYPIEAVRGRQPGNLVGAPSLVHGTHSVDVLAAVKYNNAYPLQRYEFQFTPLELETQPTFYNVEGWKRAYGPNGSVAYIRENASNTSAPIAPNAVVAKESTSMTISVVEGNVPYTWSADVGTPSDAGLVYGTSLSVLVCSPSGTFFLTTGAAPRRLASEGATQVANAGTTSLWSRAGQATEWTNLSSGDTMEGTEAFDTLTPIALDTFVAATLGQENFYVINGMTGKVEATYESAVVSVDLVKVGPAVYSYDKTNHVLSSMLLAPSIGLVTTQNVSNPQDVLFLFGFNDQVLCVSSNSDVFELDTDEWVKVRGVEGVGNILAATQYDAKSVVLGTSTGVYEVELYAPTDTPTRLDQFGQTSTDVAQGALCWNQQHFGLPVTSNIRTSGNFAIEVTQPTVKAGPNDGMIAGYTLIGVFAAAAGILLGLSYGTHAKRLWPNPTHRLLVRIFGFLSVAGLALTAGLTFGLPGNRNLTKPAPNGTPVPDRLLLPMHGWYGNAGRTPIELGEGPANGNAYWSYYGHTNAMQVLANAGSPVTPQGATPFLVCGGTGLGQSSVWTSATLESYTFDALQAMRRAGWHGVVFYVQHGDDTVTPEAFDQVFQTAHDVGLLVGVTVPGTAPSNMPALKNQGSLNNDSPGAWTYAFVSNPLVAFFSPRNATKGTTQYDIGNIIDAHTGRGMAIIPSVRTPTDVAPSDQLFNQKTSGHVLWFSDT